MRTISRPFARFLVALLLTLMSVLALAACDSGSPASNTPAAPLYAKDANGTTVVLPTAAPQRIVSLGPTDSEILAALHLQSRVLAVDYYTNYPAEMASKQKITDAQGKANVEAIVALKPDLVLSYGGETVATDKQLMQASINVVDLPVADLTGSIKEVRFVGQLVKAESDANALADQLQKRVDAVKSTAASAQPVSVYMEADDSTPGKPYAFGGGSFGDEIISVAGGTNIFHVNSAGNGYPQVNDEAVIAANPQVIILTEDPNYGGDPKLVYSRPGWSSTAAVKNNRVFAVSPDYLQRAGPRLVDGLEQVAKILHPDLFK